MKSKFYYAMKPQRSTIVFFICFVLMVNQNKANGEKLCCQEEFLVSANRTIAPFELVTVSKNISSLPNLDLTRVYNFGYDQFLDSWCSDNFDTLRQVELGFTVPILITAMVSGGRIESGTSPGSSSYVSGFTLDYRPAEDPSNYETYTVDGSLVKKFLVPEINTLFKLDVPILTEGIRINILQWVDDEHPPGSDFQFVCQGVAIYGCLASEVLEDSGSPVVQNNTGDNSPFFIAFFIVSVVIAIILTFVVIVLGYKLMWMRRELIKQQYSIYARLERVPQVPSSCGQENKILRPFVGQQDTNTAVPYGDQMRRTSVEKMVEIPMNERNGYRRKVDIYASGSFGYESVEPKAHGKDQNNSQRVSGAEVIGRGLPSISEESGEVFTSTTGNSYELIDSHSTLNRMKPPQIGDNSISSLITNSAYGNQESMTNHPGLTEGDVEEQEEYEAMVRLHRNESYSHMQVEAGDSPTGPDYYNAKNLLES